MVRAIWYVSQRDGKQTYGMIVVPRDSRSPVFGASPPEPKLLVFSCWLAQGTAVTTCILTTDFHEILTEEFLLLSSYLLLLDPQR